MTVDTLGAGVARAYAEGMDWTEGCAGSIRGWDSTRTSDTAIRSPSRRVLARLITIETSFNIACAVHAETTRRTLFVSIVDGIEEMAGRGINTAGGFRGTVATANADRANVRGTYAEVVCRTNIEACAMAV